MTGHKAEQGTDLAPAEARGSLSTHSASRSTEAPWSAPSWLETWHFTDAVPASKHDVERAIFATERALEPVSPEAIKQGIKRLLDAMNPPSQGNRAEDIAADLGAWWKRNQDIYVAALADLPADLLKAGSAGALKHCRFMPKPADIRKPVEDELARRQVALTRLRGALLKVPPPEAPKTVVREPLTEEQQARIDRFLGRARVNDMPLTEDERAASEAARADRDAATPKTEAA